MNGQQMMLAEFVPWDGEFHHPLLEWRYTVDGYRVLSPTVCRECGEEWPCANRRAEVRQHRERVA